MLGSFLEKLGFGEDKDIGMMRLYKGGEDVSGCREGGESPYIPCQDAQWMGIGRWHGGGDGKWLWGRGDNRYGGYGGRLGLGCRREELCDQGGT